jgi:hypothetical protein
MAFLYRSEPPLSISRRHLGKRWLYVYLFIFKLLILRRRKMGAPSTRTDRSPAPFEFLPSIIFLEDIVVLDSLYGQFLVTQATHRHAKSASAPGYPIVVAPYDADLSSQTQARGQRPVCLTQLPTPIYNSAGGISTRTMRRCSICERVWLLRHRVRPPVSS